MKNVLITGSSRGLGLEIAKKIEDNNIRLILTGRDENSLKKARDSLKYPQNHFILEIDFEESLDQLFNLIESKNLIFDSVIHNLGVNISGDSHPINLEILKKTMQLNLYTAIEINSALIEQRFNTNGKIIHIGSNIGYTGNASPSYSISKGALNTYIKNIARYYAKSNVSICGVLPGPMEHEGSSWYIKKSINKSRYDEMKKSLPLGKFCQTDEVALFVKNIYESDTRIINGSLFNIDGGI